MDREAHHSKDDVDCQVSKETGIEAVARRTLKALVEGRKAKASVGVSYVRAFCTFLLSADEQSCLRLVAQLQERGASHDLIADQLIAEAARELGARWDKDELSFAEVSLGISTLLMVNAAVRSVSEPATITKNRRVMFATLPHQAHTLGIGLAAEVFRQRGWDISVHLRLPKPDIIDEVRRTEADLVGFTAGRKRSLDELIVVAAQIQSLPHSPRVMIGGIAAVSSVTQTNGMDDITIVESVEHALKLAEEL
ncbi:cobalamin B12-binding domain-containing protein [Marivita geojedonensis]|uniref:B12-binding domain-containing protein n=1 Tax=Marivita geojedonensis TaxID=1123756 RepID=A0A1X4N8H6_9RHOB|nr:cobalamin-dependent protein [Marivita geojedonensis]OSQ42468.1 hypothetical protein MGEO_20500 [Marivita geojedonensis]PRY71414.1 methanogenic corrinoid protein MtbC1 [Marivita geojedonensis]